MSYLWSSQGPSFQYPGCYRVENRFLTLRAAMLIVAALAVFWVALSDPDPDLAGAVQLQLRGERGSAVPHVLMALLMLLLGGIDLLTAARQRRVLLVPGQPASLTSEVTRRASGTSSGAAWLMQVMRDGQVPAAEPQGEYAGALRALAGPLLHAPSSLLTYLRVRAAHLIAGLALLLALALTWPAAARPSTLALAALLYAALAAALVAHSAWIAKAAPSPFALGAALLLTLAVGVGIALFGQGVPHVERLNSLALPQATLLVLLCLLLIEGLGLLAARQQRGAAPRAELQGADASADIDAEPALLMQEVERELHRFWAEGIPNRRHAWEPPAEAGVGNGAVAKPAAVVLEESQPMPAAEPAPTSTTWLLALGLLGLAFTAAGAVLWVRLAYQQINSLPNASWVTAAPSLVLLVAGGYALRVGHLLWSRVEVDSMLLWLTVQAAPAAAREGLLQLKARVLKARSVFHAAGEHQLGSRVLLQLTADGAVARRLVQQVQGFAERAGGGATAAAAAAAAPAAARPGAAAPARAAAAAAATPQRAPAARFCPACGAPQPAGARFCPRCGAAQPGA